MIQHFNNSFCTPSICIVLVIIFSSCSATYNANSKSTELSLLNSNFTEANESLETNKMLKKKQNRLLYLLEKGKLEHINKNYSASNQYFEEAYYLIEDRGSNTGAKIAAAFTNPEAIPYPAEDFEKTTIHYYKALNFFQLGQYDNALVEAKRINIKLNRLNENYKENKNRYDEDAFAHILQGIIYEAQGNINDAFIAYRNAADCYLKNDNDYFGVATPTQLKKDVVRTAALLNFSEEQQKYETLFGIRYDGITVQDEAIIFWENGLGPYKEQTKISFTAAGGIGAGTFQNEELGFAIPIPTGANLGITAVAFPKYLERTSYYSNASLQQGSSTYPFEMAENFNTIAAQCLKDRMGREIKDVIIRVVTKKATSKGLKAVFKELGGSLAGDIAGLAADGVNAATEKADTRNWQSLPSTISYARIPLKTKDPVLLKLSGSTTDDEIELMLSDKKGIQLVNHITFGRELGVSSTSNTSYTIPDNETTVSYDDDINTVVYNNPVLNTTTNSTQQVNKTATMQEDNGFVHRIGSRLNYGFNENGSLGFSSSIAFSKNSRGSLAIDFGGTYVFSSFEDEGADYYVVSAALDYGYYITPSLRSYVGAGYYYTISEEYGLYYDSDNPSGFYYHTGFELWLTNGFGTNIRFDNAIGTSVGLLFKF
jgi:hypothetical protein